PNNPPRGGPLAGGGRAKPFAVLFAALGLKPVAAMLRLAPVRLPPKFAASGRHLFPASAPRRGRVALLTGCVSPVIAPAINAATIRLLTRHGIEVVVADEGCCRSLVHHMGRASEALSAARRQVDAWTAEIEGEGLDAILVTASGCGTTVKDYGYLLRTDEAYAAKALRVSRLAKDISEYLSGL